MQRMRGRARKQYFFSSVIKKSVELWNKCIEKGGEYVEK
jgi:hypothetical protein